VLLAQPTALWLRQIAVDQPAVALFPASPERGERLDNNRIRREAIIAVTALIVADPLSNESRLHQLCDVYDAIHGAFETTIDSKLKGLVTDVLEEEGALFSAGVSEYGGEDTPYLAATSAWRIIYDRALGGT
jgi:hypothetical protein